MIKAIILTLSSLHLLACSELEEPEQTREYEPEYEEITTPWDDQTETIEHFEEAEQFVLDAAERRKREMDQQLQ